MENAGMTSLFKMEYGMIMNDINDLFDAALNPIFEVVHAFFAGAKMNTTSNRQMMSSFSHEKYCKNVY